MIVRSLALCFMLLVGCSSSTETGTDAGTSDVKSGDVAPGAPMMCEGGPGEVFEERIRPLLENDRPSSCAKCHAAGVDLAAFVTGDACGSMQCLVSQGLVDLENPTESQLLTFISRGYNPAEGTGVTDAMVREEYKGFLEWIQWASECMEATCPESRACNSRPPTPLADAGYVDTGPPPPALNLENYPCGEAHQLQAFYDHAYPPEARCGHCHSPAGAIAGVGDAPLWMARSWTMTGAETTIQNLYKLRAINLDKPNQSRVLLKPLHPDAGGIEHGGGSKFLDTTDPLYVALLTWIEMQAQCRRTHEYPPVEEFSDDSKY